MFAFALFAILITVIFGYYKWTYQYWQRKNLPYLETRIPFGHLTNPLSRTENIGIIIARYYKEIKERNWKHAGLYFILTPVYLVVDLDHVKNILLKNFEYFSDRGLYYNEKDDPISAHLIAITGPKWKSLRAKITPIFTSTKLKMMFPTILDCESHLRENMLIEHEKKKPINIKEIAGDFTMDFILSYAFGLDCKTSENSPLKVYSKKVFDFSILRFARSTFATEFPELARKMRILTVPREISDFFMKIIVDTVNYREKNNYRRKDFMQLLIDLKNNKQIEEDDYKHDGKCLTMEELAAQCWGFFLAGFETSSTTISFALYELAKNQEIQDDVRQEINTVLAKHDNKITYDSINDMKYLQQVIDEALRMHPAVLFLKRKCVKNYTIPDENIIIEKGTTVLISVHGIHHDEEYYPNPNKFDPERFTEENKKSRPRYAYIPFGEGPRICTGIKLALMQLRVGLISFLKSYRFTVNKKTQEPLKVQPKAFILAAEGEIWLDAEKL